MDKKKVNKKGKSQVDVAGSHLVEDDIQPVTKRATQDKKANNKREDADNFPTEGDKIHKKNLGQEGNADTASATKTVAAKKNGEASIVVDAFRLLRTWAPIF